MDFWREYGPVCDAYHAGTMTTPQWRDWRGERLRTVLAHVTARSDFYRRHLAGVDLTEVTPATLGLLPFTTKADLQRELHAVLSGPVSDALVFYETTGTTGPPTPCPRDAKDVASSNAHVERSWRSLFRHHFGDRLPTVALMGPSELYAFGDTFGDVAQRIGACHLKLWPESPRVGFRTALRLLHELSVEVVVGAPALCLNLARAARHYGYDLRRDFAIRVFGVLGEICTPEFAANVASVWPGATVHPMLYGSQEALAIATGCAHGRLHVSQLNYLVEVLDPDTGRGLGGTGVGELCLTMLVDGIKPLIRYRTGDLVSVRGNDCGCDLPGLVVDVVGRVADRIDLGTGPVYPAQLEAAVLDGVRGCLGYQVVIDATPDGRDRLTVRLELVERVDVGRVADRLRRRFGVEVDVVVSPELDPITNTGAFVSWKTARIQDNRSAADPALPVARRAAALHTITS